MVAAYCHTTYNSVVGPDSLNSDQDLAFQVNPDPDQGFR
jgi:hypothetical protein